MKKIPISVIVITKNEEDNIGACLEKVNWADEIIVVDDNSTDRTREIAARYTDKIFVRAMENEGKHRNWAYSKAANKWVLSVDADERVTEELAREIGTLISGNPEFKAYTIPRRNHIGSFWLRHGGEYPASQTRLFLKDEFKYEEAEVHPRALMRGGCGHLKGDLIHYSHRDISDYVTSLNGHTTLEARKWLVSERKMGFGRAVRRTLDRCFYRRLWRKKAYKDGVYGFVVAVFSGIYQLVSWVKCWEMKIDPATRGLKTVKISDSGGLSNPEGRLKISAVVITKNAAGKLRNCLESIKWVDEIVIVDARSTDGTLDIAGEYSDKIILSDFEGFAKERNKGIDASTGDWILQLDADEIVTDAFRARMERVLRGEDEGCASFKFRRRNVFLGKAMSRGGWFHYSAHLFRKGYARYEGDIHETLVVDGRQGKMEEEIEHYPFDSIGEFIDRQNRYTSLQAAEMFKKNGPASIEEVRYNLIVRSRKLFLKMYLKKLGFMEGMRGLVFSVMFAWVHFVKWSKYWELGQMKNVYSRGNKL